MGLVVTWASTLETEINISLFLLYQKAEILPQSSMVINIKTYFGGNFIFSPLNRNRNA